ncbi:hypothetical protein EWM64_g3662 [Hericium alpestre]|uniref:Protein kinase domain-containing protein n=1 Tax=Hericium alpestre TaxID=135208 RepID=A0A4Y9ZZP9_9AGAM|nr:hypothetical protein EWM64_g3662 [Hericium alpestre]
MNEQPDVVDEDLMSQLPASIAAWKALDVMTDPDWFRPWETLRPWFRSKGYELYRPPPGRGLSPTPYDASSPSPLSFDNFELFGDRGDGFQACFLSLSSVVFPARDTHVLCHRPHENALTRARRSNRDVIIKVVSKGAEGDNELSILTFLHSARLGSSVTVPVLGVLQLGEWSFVVMPYCNPCAQVPVLNAHECLDFTEQILCDNGIAHLDISYENILINHHGRQPPRIVSIDHTPVWVDPPHEFRSTFPVRYLFIDFGLSRRCPDDGQPSRWRVEPSSVGRVQRAPETSEVRYDPFAADVYQLGRLLYAWFYDAVPDIPGFLQLLKDMTNVRPQDRPSASRAMERFVALRSQVPADILFQTMDMQPSGFNWPDPHQEDQSA